MTSGINTIEPLTKYNPDGSLKSLKIVQTASNIGMNRLRKSKIDIAFYDKDYKIHVLKDFVLSDKNHFNPVNQELISKTFKGPIKALVLNHGDHLYTKTRFDKKTLKNL